MSGGDEGYRLEPAGGVRVRADIVDLYVFRRRPGRPTGEIEFLQVRRTREPLARSWHPVIGHMEPGESAVGCVRREMREEIGLSPGGGDLVGLWALEQVHPFFVAQIDAIVMSPRFAAMVREGWEPTLNEEHDAARWVERSRAQAMFLWPGQWAACAEIERYLACDHPAREALRLPTSA